MNFLYLLICLFLITGCQQQDQPRQYTEIVAQAPQVLVPPPVAEEKPVDNPHAGLDMANITPDAKANLQKMLAEGQDPHAGIDMSAFAENNPTNTSGGSAGQGTGNIGQATPSPYSWTLPKGWKQGADKVMRLASFYIEKDPNAIDCYIVVLPGMAGGVEANLKRWMGQIGLDPSDSNYRKLTDSAKAVQTQGGLQPKFYDLASLQQGPAEKSMIAAILSNNDTTVFVKMTGTKDHVQQNQDSFLEFLKSLVPKS